MAANHELTLGDYLSILQRRWKSAVAVLVSGIVATILVAVIIPPVYESSGTILIESQQIPSDMVQGAVNSPVQERIELIKQRVMTRETLLQIINKYNLYKDQRKDLTPSELVEEIRNAIKIDLVSAATGSTKKGSSTVAFKLSFEYTHAFAAFKVANELTTLFLNENAKSRTEKAAETTEFLAKETQRLKADLEKIETQVSTYKREHAGSLPEHQELRMSAMSRDESSLADVEREYRSAQEELNYLDVELEAAKAGVGRGADSNSVSVSPATELEKLKGEYTKLIATYTENHPSVRALKRRIEILEKSEAAAPVAATPKPVAESANPAQSLLVAKVQAKINMTKDRLASLALQQKALRARIGQLEKNITTSPNVELGLTTLMRDYENAKRKYEETQAKQMSAQLSENLEQDNKAEKFSLIEPPQLSDKPIKPDRIKIILIGFMMALGGAFGFVAVTEGVNQRMFGADALTSVMHAHPLVVIPYITLIDESLSKRKRIIAAAFVAAVLIVLALILTHLFYMPLNVLLFKTAARFG